MRIQHLAQITAIDAESSPLFVTFDFVENVLQCARQKTYQEARKYVSVMCFQTSIDEYFRLYHSSTCGSYGHEKQLRYAFALRRRDWLD